MNKYFTTWKFNISCIKVINGYPPIYGDGRHQSIHSLVKPTPHTQKHDK